MFHDLIPTSALRRVLWWSLALAAYSGLAVWKESGDFARYADFPAGLELALSLAIGLLLAFRVNRAFERWWEGRTLWSTLANACRNMAVKANNVVLERDESLEGLQQLVAAFPRALRDHLRDGASLEQLKLDAPSLANLKTADQQTHLPSWIANQIYGVFEKWKREQRIQYGEFRMLDRDAKMLLEVCGNCERIKDTPIAISFRVLLNQALAFFLLSLPWGLVTEFGPWTILITFVTSYFVLAAEGIADHVEQPFYSSNGDGDGLNLDRICAEIETSVREIFATETVATRIE